MNTKLRVDSIVRQTTVLIDLREQGSVPRRRIFQRFQRDDEAAVAAILNDLVSSGLAYSTGRGGSALFGLTSAVDQERMDDEDLRTTLPAMAWLVIYREGPLDAAALQERLGLDVAQLAAILAELERESRVQREPDTGRYRSGTMTIAMGDRAGWEAAVLDHFQGVAKAIAAKVRLGPHSELAGLIGGATLSFDVHPGHPLEAEVYDLLRQVRLLVNDLWNRLAAHNRAHPIADQEKIKVTFYLGQNVERAEPEESGSSAPRGPEQLEEGTAGAAYVDVWEALVANDPYAIPFSGDDANGAVADTGTRFPLLLADSFIAAATQPAVYYGLLDVPERIESLLVDELGIDVSVPANFEAGFVEEAEFLAQTWPLSPRAGYLWMISDVGRGPGALFANPLDSPLGERELVFTLPNGLEAFAFMSGNGQRLDGWTVTADSGAADGMARVPRANLRRHPRTLALRDEVRDYAARNPDQFDPSVLSLIRQRFPGPEALALLLERDYVAFEGTALLRLGLPDAPDPILRSISEFERDVSLAVAAAELMVTPEDLRENLLLLDPALAALDGGAVSRSVFTGLYPATVCILSAVLENQLDPAGRQGAGRHLRVGLRKRGHRRGRPPADVLLCIPARHDAKLQAWSSSWVWCWAPRRGSCCATA